MVRLLSLPSRVKERRWSPEAHSTASVTWRALSTVACMVAEGHEHCSGHHHHKPTNQVFREETQHWKNRKSQEVKACKFTVTGPRA